MIIQFNKLNQYETPLLTLCNLASYAITGDDGSVELTDTIGCLFDISDVEIVWNFNALSELNFVVQYSEDSDDPERDAESQRMYNAVRTKRSVFVEGYGYFIIDTVNPKLSDGVKTKDVHAYSCEYEFQTTALPYIPENKRLGVYGGTKQSSDTCILDNVLLYMPTWTIDEKADETVLARTRFFENTNYDNCYEFMMQEMQSAYECIFEFDILHRVIKIYDQNSYVKETSIHLTPDDFIKGIDIQEDTDSFYTALYVTGQDDINILPVNPLGTNIIYNLDYYKDDMTTDTLAAWESWESKVAGYREPYSLNEENYQIELLTYISTQSDVDILQIQLDIYNTCYDAVLSESLTEAKIATYNDKLRDVRAAIIGEGEGNLHFNAQTVRDDILRVLRPKIAEVQSALSSAQSRLDYIQGDDVDDMFSGISSFGAGYYHNSNFYATRTGTAGNYSYSDLISGATNKVLINIETVSNEDFHRVYKYNGGWDRQTPTLNLCLAIRKYIANELAFSENFTDGQLLELNSYIHQGKYEDLYAIITTNMTYAERMAQYNEMYDRAVALLNRTAEPSYKYTIDSDNFTFVSDMQHFTNELETGRLVWIELDDGNFAQLFLTAITINYSDASLSLTFGNRYNKYDTKSLYDDALGNISKTASSVDILKNLTYPIKKNKLTDLEEMILKIRTLAKDEALRSDTEEVTIDSGGYLGRALEESGDFSPEQMKLVHNKLLFTDNAWETIKTVIGKLDINGQSKYGVNAEVLIGEMIMGGALVIRNSGNNFIIDDTGIKMEFVSDKDGNKHISFTDGSITLYSISVDTATSDKLKLGDGFIRFYGDPTIDNNHEWEPNEAAYLSRDSFNFYNGRIFNQLNFQRSDMADDGSSADKYSWLFFPRTNGNFSIKWTGESV